jgi:hypothetical protein
MAAELTAESVRAQVVNGLIESLQVVIRASDEAAAAWKEFRQARTNENANRLQRAMSLLARRVDEYIDGAREGVRRLEVALRDLIAESMQGDNRGEQPALSRAIAVRDGRAA